MRCDGVRNHLSGRCGGSVQPLNQCGPVIAVNNQNSEGVQGPHHTTPEDGG